METATTTEIAFTAGYETVNGLKMYYEIYQPAGQAADRTNLLF